MTTQHSLAGMGEVYSTFILHSQHEAIGPATKGLDDATLLRCLLCAVVKRLGEVSEEVASLRRASAPRTPARAPDRPCDPIAAGLLASFNVSLGDLPIEQCDLKAISIRARKAIQRGGYRFLSEITSDSLLELRNCGISTAREIEAWKERCLGRHEPEGL